MPPPTYPDPEIGMGTETNVVGVKIYPRMAEALDAERVQHGYTSTSDAARAILRDAIEGAGRGGKGLPRHEDRLAVWITKEQRAWLDKKAPKLGYSSGTALARAILAKHLGVER